MPALRRLVPVGPSTVPITAQSMAWWHPFSVKLREGAPGGRTVERRPCCAGQGRRAVRGHRRRPPSGEVLRQLPAERHDDVRQSLRRLGGNDGYIENTGLARATVRCNSSESKASPRKGYEQRARGRMTPSCSPSAPTTNRSRRSGPSTRLDSGGSVDDPRRAGGSYSDRPHEVG
jgi:hypothetical protein